MIGVFFLVGIVYLAIVIGVSVAAYNSGVETGNVTTAIVLLLIGLFLFGITLIPGICYLAGTSKYTQNGYSSNDKKDNKPKVKNVEEWNKMINEEYVEDNVDNVVINKTKNDLINENRLLENEKLKIEIEYYKSLLNKRNENNREN